MKKRKSPDELHRFDPGTPADDTAEETKDTTGAAPDDSDAAPEE